MDIVFKVSKTGEATFKPQTMEWIKREIQAACDSCNKTGKTVKEVTCYDEYTGESFELRRNLTKRQWLKVSRRKANGERLADILAEMKVLK